MKETVTESTTIQVQLYVEEKHKIEWTSQCGYNLEENRKEMKLQFTYMAASILL